MTYYCVFQNPIFPNFSTLRSSAAQIRVARERLMPLMEDAWSALERFSVRR